MTTKQEVKVFVSKKEKHLQIARDITRKLDIIGGQRLTFFMSEKIPSGNDWNVKLLEALADADILMFLYMGPDTGNYDWPIYEAGLYTPLPGEKKPIICLMPEGVNPPDQLRHVQAVQAEPKKMKTFLKDFFGTDKITGINPPINRKFVQDEKELTTLAQLICDKLNQGYIETLTPVYYCRRMVFVVDPSEVTHDFISPDVEVVADRVTLEIFGFAEERPGGRILTWSMLDDKMPNESDKEWKTQLAGQLNAACQGEVLLPVSGTLRSLVSGKVYRPSVYKREGSPDGKMKIEVALIHQPHGREIMLPVKIEE